MGHHNLLEFKCHSSGGFDTVTWYFLLTWLDMFWLTWYIFMLHANVSKLTSYSVLTSFFLRYSLHWCNIFLWHLNYSTILKFSLITSLLPPSSSVYISQTVCYDLFSKMLFNHKWKTDFSYQNQKTKLYYFYLWQSTTNSCSPITTEFSSFITWMQLTNLVWWLTSWEQSFNS